MMVQIKKFTIGPLVVEIFEFENVDTQPDRQTDRQTTARLVYYKLTFGSGELKFIRIAQDLTAKRGFVNQS